MNNDFLCTGYCEILALFQIVLCSVYIKFTVTDAKKSMQNENKTNNFVLLKTI